MSELGAGDQRAQLDRLDAGALLSRSRLGEQDQQRTQLQLFDLTS